MLMALTACSEFALLTSGASIAASQNAYSRAYSGLDILTIVRTDKDIKAHIYDNIKKATNDD
tara:strand:+ start:345 stop:530 length:186 start_codon:yes stop_codon:yes gene_type:complete